MKKKDKKEEGCVDTKVGHDANEKKKDKDANPDGRDEAFE